MSFPLTSLIAMLDRGDADDGLAKLYGTSALNFQKTRYKTLLDEAERKLDGQNYIFASAPGRTELGGNHTDHNNGRVLASAVDLDCVAAVTPSHEPIVTLFSDDFTEPIIVDLRSLTPDRSEQGSSHALIRGVAAARKRSGKTVDGFSGIIHSTCRPGTGLSTSAAFSVLIGGIFALLCGDENVDPVQLARDAQYAENNFFGKPCGLMDQLSSSVGTTLGIDFKNPTQPAITKIEFRPENSGYRLIVIDTGGCHVNLTPEYAAVTEEIAEATALLNREKARGITLETVLDRIPEIRAEAGDRALLRLMHFILEDTRAARQLEALQRNDFNQFLTLVKQSGASSCSLLQNCNTSLNSREQGIMLARALSEQFFPDSLCRVHGGGFAGTAQAYVPTDQFDAYRDFMVLVFGSGSVIPIRIGRPGFCAFTETGWLFPEIREVMP